MLTVTTQPLVWKPLEYMQSTLISTCNELCRYTLHLRYGILGQKGDAVFPGLSAAAVWLTAIARNLKVTVSCLSDSAYPTGFWLLRKTGLPLALLLFGSTTVKAQIERTFYSWGCCGHGIAFIHVSNTDVNPWSLLASVIAPAWCIRLDWARVFQFTVKRSGKNEWIMKWLIFILNNNHNKLTI